MNEYDYKDSVGSSLSERPPSHSQSILASSIVMSLIGAISSSLQDMKESDINPKNASVISLVFILISFKF